MNAPFWLKDPTILFKKNKILNVYPKKGMNKNEKLNALTRATILFTILAFLFTKKPTAVILGISCLVVIVFIYYNQPEIKEGLQINSNTVVPNENKMYTEPSKKNPIMNVSQIDIKENPKRPRAAPSFEPQIEEKINKCTQDFILDSFSNNEKEKDSIQSKLFKDLGDKFNFDQSMRSFYTTANSTVPDNQKSFAEFLYGDMISGKDGHETSCLQKQM